MWAVVSVTRTKSRTAVASSICGPGRRKGIRSFFAGDSSETCHLNLLDRQSGSEDLHSWRGSAAPAKRGRGRHRRPGRNRSLADHSRGGRRAPSYANLAGRRHRGRAQSAAEQRFWLRGFEDRTRVEQHDFNFINANGSGVFSEDGVQECLIVPPFPIRFGCRPYPVWVIELSGPSCQATIAINARSGRFGGAGTDGCDIVPEAGPPPMMFVAEWE